MLYNTEWEKKVEIKLEPWQEMLIKAADRLEERGWCQGKYGDPEGPNCALGAVIWSTTSKTVSARNEAVAALTTAVGDDVARWNDDPSQTKGNVIATMRQVAGVKPHFTFGKKPEA